MKLSFVLAAAVAGAMLATPAAARDPRGSRDGSFGFNPNIYGSFYPSPLPPNCRRHAFQCGVSAYYRQGPREGLAWFEYGARRGSAPAMRSIGMILMRGDRGIPADPAAAMGWFYEAALRGDGPAMYALSVGFEHGAGAAPDPALARFWRERAARAGDEDARRALRRAQ